MTLILLLTHRSVADNSNGIGGDKIEALLMVAAKGRDFGVVDSGGSDDDGGSWRHLERQDYKEHTKKSEWWL